MERRKLTLQISVPEKMSQFMVLKLLKHCKDVAVDDSLQAIHDCVNHYEDDDGLSNQQRVDWITDIKFDAIFETEE